MHWMSIGSYKSYSLSTLMHLFLRPFEPHWHCTVSNT